MSTFYLEYPIQKGYLRNWLVAGPYATPVSDLERFEGEGFKLQIAQHHYRRFSEILEPPRERDSFQIGDTELTWQYYRCDDDHFVDRSTFHHTPHYLRSWAYTQLVCPSPQEVTFVLTTNGPADVWVNGQHAHRQEHFCHQDPKSVSFEAQLREDRNEVLVRFEEVAIRECPYVMALEVQGLAVAPAEDAAALEPSSSSEESPDEDKDQPKEAVVQVPTYIENVRRRQLFELMFEYAHLESSVSYEGTEIRLHWSDELIPHPFFSCAYRLMDWRNRIYIEGVPKVLPGATQTVGRQLRFEGGRYRVVLMPSPEEYYRGNMRYQRDLPIQVLESTYSEEPYGTYEQRRREGLQYAAQQEGDLYAEVAKFSLGRGASVDRDVVMSAVDQINQREDCSDFHLVGLLGLMHRYMGSALFPSRLKGPLEECVLGFRYWHDEPGSDAMCFTTENHSILFHTCEILAAQLYPDRTFSNAGQTGQWHREKGERLALDWLYKRGTAGFSEWDSNTYFEEDLLALSHLADLAEHDQVRELAAVLMDKLFFTMALNSYKGVFGSTHGRTYAPMIKEPALEATSGITRLMWGTGIWNTHIRGVVALASSEYVLPPIIPEIATLLPEEMWDQERHVGVNKVTYRTPDYMLSSAQDYNPGQRGYQQHIWQATLGPGAVVFVTHPPCMSEEGAHRPNFWHGNYVLPRVAQWKDTLIAIHSLPEEDWMGFTHAYFPVHQFTEYVIREGWAFGRKGGPPPPSDDESKGDSEAPSGNGDQPSEETSASEGAPSSDAEDESPSPGVEVQNAGYIALTAAGGLELTKRGTAAYSELRSYGQHNTWLCLMGRQATDGSFEEFQEKVLSLPVSFQDLGVELTTLRGESLSFGWEGPFLVNGEERPLSGFKHYENPYCVADFPAEVIDIVYGEFLLRLHFEQEVVDLISDSEPTAPEPDNG